MKGGDTVEKEQIAHDLAVAKLCGSSLPNEKLVEQYRKYYEEIYDCISSEEKEKPKIVKSPI